MTEHDDDVSYDELEVKPRSGKVVEVKKIREDIYLMRLELSEPMKYLPGQYILVDHDVDGKRAVRAYTFVSSSADPNSIELAIQRTADTLTSHLITSKTEGSTFDFRGPYGHFVWTEKIPADTLSFVAVNIGINPFISMLRYIEERAIPVRARLLYHWDRDDGFGDVPYREELDRLVGKIDLTYTVVEDINSMDGIEEHVNSDLLYICGEKRVTNPFVERLSAMGVEYTKLEQWF